MFIQRKFKKFGGRRHHKHSTTQSPVVVDEVKEEPPEQLLAQEINQESPQTEAVKDNNVPVVGKLAELHYLCRVFCVRGRFCWHL